MLMSRATTIFKKTIWITALIILILGIIFFAESFDFQIYDTYISFSAAHIGAITSGILSIVSLGYHLMRNHPFPTFIGIIHVIVTIILLCLVIYYRLMEPEDLSDVQFPNLDSSPAEVSQWQNAQTAGTNRMRYYFIWLGIQVVFLAIAGIRTFLRSKRS